jgi:hypothetical protein
MVHLLIALLVSSRQKAGAAYYGTTVVRCDCGETTEVPVIHGWFSLSAASVMPQHML